MKPSSDWITLDEPHTDHPPSPIALRIQNLGPREIFPMHTHDWHQLIYSINGSFVVALEDKWQVVTPNQAIWVPIGFKHTSGTQGGAEFRNLYVANLPGSKMPSVCTVYSVSDLLRSLVVELEGEVLAENSGRYSSLIIELLLHHLQRLPTHNFHLPWPKATMLKKYCEALFENPADEKSIDEWASKLGASSRTLSRKFESEVGITLRDWRTKLRVFHALEWLYRNQSITEIAIDLGYSSVSSFSYMFHKEMGMTPSEWRKK